MLTDPIADMLTRIRNANRALHDSASMPTSRMKEEIARILKEEGYIKDYRVVDAEPVSTLVVELKFAKDRRRVITDLNQPWGDSDTCTGCGKCVHVCPTGALFEKGGPVTLESKETAFLKYLKTAREKKLWIPGP